MLVIIISALALVFGFLYCFSSTIMPYHEDFIGMTHEEITALNPKLSDMMLVFMRLAGVMFLGLGILGISMSWKGLRRCMGWVWVTLLVSLTVVLIPLLAITNYVGASVFWVVLVMAVVFYAAMGISAKPCLRGRKS